MTLKKQVYKDVRSEYLVVLFVEQSLVYFTKKASIVIQNGNTQNG